MKIGSLIKSKFVRDSSLLSVGIIISQLINMVFYPILGRIYSPSDFALLMTITSITSILTVLYTGKYEMSIVISSTKEQSINIMALCIVLSLLFSIVSILILYFINPLLSILLKEQRLITYSYFSVIAAFSIVVFNCYNEWCVRLGRFKPLSINKISNTIYVSVGKLSLFKFNSGLVIGDTVGRFISALTCLFRIYKKDRADFHSISFVKIKEAAKHYKKFPIYIMPGQLINTLGVAAPVLLMSYYYGNEVTGYFSMAMSLLILPVNIISNAIKDVFRKKIVTELRDRGDCLFIMKKLLYPLIILSVIFGALSYPILPRLFSIVLGDRWEISGVFSQILLLMALADFIAMAYNGVLIALEKLNIIFYWQILFLFSTIMPFIICDLYNCNIDTTLLYFSISRAIAYVVYVLISFYYAGRNSLL